MPKLYNHCVICGVKWYIVWDDEKEGSIIQRATCPDHRYQPEDGKIKVP